MDWIIGGLVVAAAILILVRFFKRDAKGKCDEDGCGKYPGGCAGCPYAPKEKGK